MSATSDLLLLTNHARLLLAVAEDPRATMRELGDSIGVTERAAHRLMSDLCRAGYVERHRDGRCNSYVVDPDAPLSALRGVERRLTRA